MIASSSPTSWRSRWVRGGVVLALACCAQAAFGWPWRAEPQPLLEGRKAIWSDADSPLAWDQSAGILWHLSDGGLRGAFWNGSTFVTRWTNTPALDRRAGLLADPSLHIVYFVDGAGQLQSLRRAPGAWRLRAVSDVPVTRLLAVDARRHTVFAYSGASGSIYSFAYTGSAGGWAAVQVATGLGSAPEAGAFDSRGRVLYTTHESAEASVPRHPDARILPDPTGIGEWKPWPLVATSWDEATGAWSSVVLDETGVPQQPAVRLTDRRVFYAQRDEPDLVSYFQPADAARVESRGTEAGWSGTDTFEDHHHYKIQRPDYPPAWGGSSYSGAEVFSTYPQILPTVILQSPISIVPCYVPVWTNTPLPTRLTRFRALIDARQNRLIQHRTIARGESVRQQTGRELIGYLYQDKTGILASSMRPRSNPTPAGAFVTYPKLDATFDPNKPPASFAQLASPYQLFEALRRDTTLAIAYDAETLGLPRHATIDPAAAWIAPYLRLPSGVTTRNFGHNYASNKQDQSGGRYREFDGPSTSLAASSQLAVDALTGAAFYTQATQPSTVPLPADAFTGFGPADFAAFAREPDPKLPRHDESVWIVIVY